MPMSQWRTVFWRGVRTWGLAAGCAALAATAYGQLRQPNNPLIQQPQQPKPVAGNDAANREATEGVFIPESSAAQERLELAKRMERQKEWNKAADVYQEILTEPKYAAKVVPVETDPEHRL